MENNSTLTNLTSKIQDYLNRAEFLAEKLSENYSILNWTQVNDLSIVSGNKVDKIPDDVKTRGSSSIDLRRAEFLIREAINEDEAGHEGDAIELYLQAVEVCLKTVGDLLFAECDLSRERETFD